MNKLYTLSGTTLYQYPGSNVIDDMVTPWDIESPVDISASKTVTTTDVNITVASSATRSSLENKKMYEDLVATLKDEKIASIVKMTNKFKMFANLVIYDRTKKVIEEGVRIHPVEAKDVILLASMNKESGLNYTKGKEFILSIPIMFPKASLGIVRDESMVPKYIQIKGIEIMAVPDEEGSTEIIKSLNQTILDRTLPENSPSVSALEDNLVRLYSTYQDSISFKPIGLAETPVTLTLNFDVLLAGFTEAYDDSVITKIITENGGVSPKPDPTPDPKPTPGGDDDSNYFAQFERQDKSYPGAGIVVADKDYEVESKTKTCFKYSEVVADIPDIQIGEYVAYVESLVVFNL